MQGESSKEAKVIFASMLAGLLIGLVVYFMANGSWGESFVAFGEYCYKGIVLLKPIGVVFIRLLKMVIVPLVFTSIFMAMIHLGTPQTLGSMGGRALIYYFCTTAIAVLFGLIFVNIINPGVGADLGNAGLNELSGVMASKVQGQKGLWDTIVEVLIDAIPKNPVEAMARSTILQVIVFAMLTGMVALFHPEKSSPVVRVIESAEYMVLTLTHWIMKLAPIGIFVLMLDVMAKSGFTAIVSLSKYMVTVIVGLFCHAGFLLIVASVRAKKSPFTILRGLSQALLTAFTTASSAATLPITMANVTENLKVRKETAKFVLPLGATVNMDGTALYESVAAIFIAQAYGIDLSLGQQTIIFLTASLAAIGAAAIPGAGLITMSIVLSAVGLPIEGIGLILAVDRLLDMFRTAVNVFGDSVGTIVVDSMMVKQENRAEASGIT